MPDVDAAIRIPRALVTDGRSDEKSSTRPYTASAVAVPPFANSFAALIGTRAKFKGTRWRECSACTEPYQLCEAPASIKDDGAVIPTLSELFVFFTWAMLAHTRAGPAPAGNPQEKTLCQFPNGA